MPGACAGYGRTSSGAVLGQGDDETVGAEHCLFGSECPGVGSQYDKLSPRPDHTMDDIAPVIAGFDWLSAAEKKMIFEDNARRLFKLDV